MTSFDSVAMTARWIAAARAVESRRADRLFDDPYAGLLAGAEGYELLQRMSAAARLPGASPDSENPYLAIRTRFIDDFLRDSIASTSARQVVLVAAGLDSRAFRLEWPAGAVLFELDRAEVLELKDCVLSAAGARSACDRRVAGIDVATPFGEVLVQRGFDPQRASVWIVEGLLPYLDEKGAHDVLRQCADLACPGSALVADLPGRSMLESVWTQGLLQALASFGAPWRFGTDDPETFFAAHGWKAGAKRPGEADASYGRWPFPVAPRNMPGVPQTFLVTATRGEGRG